MSILLLLLRWVSSRPITPPAAVVAILFVIAVVVLVILDNNPSVSSTAATECGEIFGGPYPLGGLDNPKDTELAQSKREAVSGLITKGLFLTKTTKMKNMEIFEGSIRGNLAFPYGVRRQMYNYVIAEDCEILVATWKDISNSALEEFLKNKCRGGRDFTPRDVKGRMINWFSEESNAALGIGNRSACWLGPLDSPVIEPLVEAARVNGLLDAVSKHFILAQGPKKTINDFDATTWPDKEVAYAGEILVDLDTCRYRLNSNSGTYQPLAKYVPNVNIFVAEQLGRDSMKISNVSPWCP